MWKLLLVLAPPLFFWTILIIVIFQVNYPPSLTQANLYQLVAFFIPLYLALTFTVHILIRKLLLCIIISLGLMILIILQGLESLNLVTGTLTVLSIGFLLSYFKGSGNSKSGLKQL